MTTPPVDLLAVGAHPDDVELTVGGTLLLANALGRSTAIAHYTEGEMGTRGSPELRREEAQAAAEMLGVKTLEFLGLPDGHLEVTDESKDRTIRLFRKLRPKVVLAPYGEDLHPDHEAVGQIVRKAAFLSGLAKWDTGQEPWRPERVMYYMTHQQFAPTMIVDVSEHFETKKRAAQCYASQFFQKDSTERMTYIAGPNFWEWWEGRARHWGHLIGVPHGEPYWLDGPIPSRDPFGLFNDFGKYRNA